MTDRVNLSFQPVLNDIDGDYITAASDILTILAQWRTLSMKLRLR